MPKPDGANVLQLETRPCVRVHSWQRKLCGTLFLVAIAMAAGRETAAAETGVREKLEAVEQTIDAERDKAANLKRRTERVERVVSQFRKALMEAGARTRELEERASTIESRLDELNREVSAKSAALDLRSKELGFSLGALARLSRRPAVALIASPYAAVDTARSAIVLGKVVPELESRARSLRRDLIELASLRDTLEAERTRYGAAQDALVKERHALRLLLERKEKSRRGLMAERSTQKKRIKTLARKAKTLQSLLAGLEAEARRVAEMERRAEDAAGRSVADKPAPPTTPGVEPPPIAAPPPKITALPPSLRNPPPRELPESFAEARGSLPLPARGRLVELFGVRTDLGTPSRGVTIATRPTATVIAPYDGKVAFAGQFRGYGELLIIAHGGGYYTLLAGMARNYGVVGQRLLAGEPVGLMSDGRNGEPRLYVELRRNGAPINPLPWLAASERKVSG